MKRLLLTGASTCVFAATFAGCYWLASYEDLSSAWGQTEAGAAIDASLDVQPSDGAPPDAQSAIDATPPPFCQGDAGPRAYCMDFDGVDAGSLGLGTNQASAVVSSASSVSPPSSLHVRVYGTGAYGAYNVQFPFQPATTATLEFDVRALTLDYWVTTLAISLFEDSTQTGRNLNVVVSPQGVFQVQEYFSLGDGGSAQNGHDDPPLDGGADAGAWHHVVLSLDLGQSTSGLTVDGQVIEANQPLGLPWATGNASISVGVTYSGGSGPEFFFDNVRADFGL